MHVLRCCLLLLLAAAVYAQEEEASSTTEASAREGRHLGLWRGRRFGWRPRYGHSYPYGYRYGYPSSGLCSYRSYSYPWCRQHYAPLYRRRFHGYGSGYRRSHFRGRRDLLHEHVEGDEHPEHELEEAFVDDFEDVEPEAEPFPQ